MDEELFNLYEALSGRMLFLGRQNKYPDEVLEQEIISILNKLYRYADSHEELRHLKYDIDVAKNDFDNITSILSGLEGILGLGGL